MTIEFQRNILRYLFQKNTKYLEYLKPELFSTVELQAMFELYAQYMNKYGKIPDKNNFIQHISNQTQLTTKSINWLKNSLVWLYNPLEDFKMVEETILLEVKKSMFRIATDMALATCESGISEEDILKVHKEISKITNLSTDSQSSGLFLLRDLNKIVKRTHQVYPTFLKTLNNMTALGGFHSPQLLVFMGPPKSYKTGMLIKFAVEYMKDGLDVMYADFENGEEDIFMRLKQAMMECKIDELELHSNTISQIKDKLLNFTGSGEIFIKKYIKKKEHFGHIEDDLNRIIDEGMNPKFLVADYLDIMGCRDSKITDKRLQIQNNYAECDYINNRYGLFTFTVSKMKQSALDTEWPGANDVAEDFEKIYNAHGVFAIMRNEQDILDNLGSIIPIVQRKGSSYSKIRCPLQIDVEHSIIREL